MWVLLKCSEIWSIYFHLTLFSKLRLFKEQLIPSNNSLSEFLCLIGTMKQEQMTRVSMPHMYCQPL